jgi:hypothetical protein
MRPFLALICSLTLASATGGAQEENKSNKPAPKKKQAQTAQRAATPGSGSPYITLRSRDGTLIAKPTPSPRNLATHAKPLKPMRLQHHHDERISGLREVGTSTKSGKPTPAAGTAAGAGKGEIILPPDTSGKTPEERLNHYINTSRQPIETLFPSDSLRHSLTRAPKSTKGKSDATGASVAGSPAMAEQPQGRPASGEKKGEKVSPTPGPQ